MREGRRTFDRLKPLSRLTSAQLAAVHSFEVDPETGRVIRLRLHDKLAANITLLRYLGGLPEAPAAPDVNIFNKLSADECRAVADLIEAVIQQREQGLREPAPTPSPTWTH